MKQWWMSQSPQDRVAIMIMAGAVSIMLLYLFAWLPFQQALEQKRQLVESQTSTLNWMKQSAREVKALKGSGDSNKPNTSNEALLTLVDRTAKQHQLRQFIQRLKPEGSDSVQLWVEQVPFDGLIRWLGLLLAQYGIAVESINIERQEQSGMINARLNLEREAR
jgi:general secretion pathway protein M